MKRTKWWLRIIGGFYVLLFLMNIVFLMTNSDAIADTIPFAVDEAGLHAFIDAWFVFVFAIGGLGAVALYASGRPQRSSMLVLALIVGELTYGVAGDMWLIARGYDPAGYIPFSVLHLIFAATGLLLLRSELRETTA